jgi:hypothetical protein
MNLLEQIFYLFCRLELFLEIRLLDKSAEFRKLLVIEINSTSKNLVEKNLLLPYNSISYKKKSRAKEVIRKDKLA